MISNAIAQKICTDFPDAHRELVACLGLLMEATDRIVTEASSKQASASLRRDFSESSKLIAMMQSISEIESSARLALNALDVQPAENDEIQDVFSDKTPVVVTSRFKATHKKPIGFQFRGGSVHQVRTWQEVLVLGVSIIREENPEKILAAISSDILLSSFIKNDASAMRKAKDIGGSLYVEVNVSAQSACDFYVRLFKVMGLPSDYLSIYLK